MMRNTSTKPAFRFPEFKEDWKPLQLKEILKEHKSRNSKNQFEEVFSVAKEKGVINQIEHLGRSYASDDISNYKVVYPNDVVYTKSPTAGFPFGIIKQNKLDRTGVVSVLYAVFKPKNIEMGLLLDFYFSSWVNTYNYLVPLVHKGAKNTMNIGNEDFLNSAKIYLPTQNEEQKKITDFLIQIDNRIAQLTEKKENLELYKKGITQKIFSQKLRFKDENGKDFPEWKKLSLGKLFSENLRPVDKPNGSYKAIGIRSHFKGTFLKFEDSERNQMDTLYQVLKDDLIVNITFAWEGAVAIAKDYDNEGLVSHRFPTYVANTSLINIRFFEFLFPNNRFKRELTIISPGGAGRNRVLKRTDFLKLKFDIPHIREQEKIASFLNEISKQIELVNEQLEETRTFKRALLSKLFC
jgi:type I restriction enzyme S subunit